MFNVSVEDEFLIIEKNGITVKCPTKRKVKKDNIEVEEKIGCLDLDKIKEMFNNVDLRMGYNDEN
jgi:hypothetical protein